MRRELPDGTVTFLFTDVAGSTRLLDELGAEAYAAALAEHRRAIREACARHGGVEVDTQGDAFFWAFAGAGEAVAAAAELIDALAAGPVRVRVGLHTGEALVTDEGYVGRDVHLAARVAASANAGQVVLTGTTAALADADLTELGEHRLKDVDGAVALFQLGRGSFAPLATVANTNLPRPASEFVGRERELDDLRARIEGGDRLVTLTGTGGAGKTRLAIEAAAALAPSFPAGVFWVDLADLGDAAFVTGTIARTLGARAGLAEHIADRTLLLVLDNFEHVVGAAPELAALVGACPRLALLVTSRERLQVQGEVEYRLPPLVGTEAVALFCARSGVAPSDEVAELCRRLDDLPLAVELAAARTSALSPGQILGRLEQRLDLLRGGRDASPRQQTLRATLDWSYELLSAGERRLFGRLSVFAGGCTLDAAEAVCDADLDTLQSLVEKSLVTFAAERYWMLETIHEYAAERLDPADAEAGRSRHRAFVVRLATGASAAGLHTAAEASISGRLDAEYANIRAAVQSALAAGEPDDVGWILGAIYPFLVSSGNPAESREWAEAALAERDRLSTRGLGEALVGAGEIARFAGDLDRAIELKLELGAFDGELQRPGWRAANLADLCEIALDQGDLARAREYLEQSVAAGGGPRLFVSRGELELREGNLALAGENAEAALEAYGEGAFNHACALELLGEISRRSGDEALARERFADGLRSFAAIGDGGGIADCFEGFARLAAAAGDVTRAGRLEGAAQRLRETRGRAPIRPGPPLEGIPDSARAEGRALTLDEAVTLALG